MTVQKCEHRRARDQRAFDARSYKAFTTGITEHAHKVNGRQFGTGGCWKNNLIKHQFTFKKAYYHR
jgi:hypothetical protein